MMNASKIEGAKLAAAKKIQGWCDVQTRAHNKKVAARAAGNTRLADAYFKAECAASNRRARRQEALHEIDKWEREQAEIAAREARKAAARAKKANA